MFDATTIPNDPALHSILTARSATQRRQILRLTSLKGLLDGSKRTQIGLVGLILLLLDPERLDISGAAMRTVGLAVVVSVLAAMFQHALQPAAAVSLIGASSARTRAMAAATAVLLAFMVVYACRALNTVSGPSPSPLVLWGAISSVLAAVIAAATREDATMILVGEADAVVKLEGRLKQVGVRNYPRVLAALDAGCPEQMDQLDRHVAANLTRTVVIAAGPCHAVHETICIRLADTEVRVMLALAADTLPQSPFALAWDRSAVAIPVVELLPPPISGWRRAIKRGFDLTFVILALPALIILMAAVAAAIRLESPGPVLFRQWRFGQGSRPVLIYKFRTMRVNMADQSGAARTLAHDPRVTQVGRVLRRLSIDELPQVFNIMRDEMSLVGPRPHPTHMKVEDVYYYQAFQAYRARHRMLPGITGWAQVNGSRGEVDTLEKAQRRIDLDLWYVANWSPILDIWIIIRTALGKFATLNAD